MINVKHTYLENNTKHLQDSILNAIKEYTRYADALLEKHQKRALIINIEVSFIYQYVGYNGLCQYKQYQSGLERYYKITYNLLSANSKLEHFLNSTLPHELAHVLCHILYPIVTGHGAEWQYCFKNLGVQKNVISKYNNYPYITETHLYKMPCCGKEIKIDNSMKLKIESKKNTEKMRCKFCGNMF